MAENKTVVLVNAWAEYERLHPDADPFDFCEAYVKEHREQNFFNFLKPVDSEGEKEKPGIPLEGMVGQYHNRIYRFALIFAKKALGTISLNNLDDFLYMVVLYRTGTPTKSELIQNNISEFTSGMEVIKRLVKMGLVEEFPDKEDKRSKRVKLTEKGKGVLFQGFGRMQQVAKIIFAGLDTREMEILYHFYRLMNNRLTELYPQVKDATIEEILERIA